MHELIMEITQRKVQYVNAKKTYIFAFENGSRSGATQIKRVKRFIDNNY